MYVLLILKFFDPDFKSYGFRRLYLIGVFVRRPEKSRSKAAENLAASSMDVGRNFYKRKPAQKSYGNGFPRVDPLPSWLSTPIRMVAKHHRRGRLLLS